MKIDNLSSKLVQMSNPGNSANSDSNNAEKGGFRISIDLIHNMLLNVQL